MSINEIQAKVNDLREYRRMVEDLEAEITAIQDSIKAHMDASGVDELTGPDYKVTWKAVETARFDSASFKKAHADLYDSFMKKGSTRRFLIA